MRRLLVATLPALLASCGAIARAADPPDADRVVALPPFLVEETGQGPPWRYGGLPGFEVLSRCGDYSTRSVVLAYYKLHQLLGVVLPEDLRFKTSEPLVIILYPEELGPGAAKEVVEQMMRTAEVRQTPREDPGFGGRGFRVPSAMPRVSFLPNLRLNDADAVFVFTIVRQDNLNTDTLYLTTDYLAFLLRRRVPALPGWFVAGFLATYREMTFRDGEITLKPLTWISDAQTAALKKDPKTALAPAPLEEFFRGDALRREPANQQTAQRWTSQASLVVRWALEPNHPERRPALWKFVARASLSASTEKTFKECFGIDFAAAQAQLAEFLPAAVRRTAYYSLASYQAPPLKLHDATPAELGRLKGDWERLEVGYVKELFAGVAPRYLEQARQTLRRAYERDPRDPRLLAVLGLYAREAGDDALARDYLEAAARGGAVRLRAWLELARLRHAEALAQPAGAGGRLGVNQAAAVLAPLFAARALQPPLAEVYRLIAEVWAQNEFPPTRAHLAVLDEGVAFFPRDTELVYRTASLYLARGWTAEARAFAELGRAAAGDDATRARFAELAARLDAAK